MSTSIEMQVVEFNEGFNAQVGPVIARTFAGEQSDLQSAGRPEGVISEGDTLPDATLTTAAGEQVGLSDVLGGSAAVLVFYRGAWCPYCNITLKTYQRDLLPELSAQGIKLVAISPQHADGTAAAVTNGDLGFDVLSDPANELASSLGIVTSPSPEAIAAHTELGFAVSDSNADGSPAIPYPTVLVVDASGVVRFVDVQVDYTSRTEVPTILDATRQSA